MSLCGVGGSGVAPVPGPDSLSGLSCWLKADSLSLNDNDTVVTWNDSSGNARNGTGVNLPKYRTAVLNGKPIVRFSNVDYFNLATDWSGFTAGHVFLVVKLLSDPPSSNARSGLWIMSTDATNAHYAFSDNIIYDGFGSNARKTTVDPGPSLASWRVYEVRSASGAWQPFLDGTSLQASVANTVAFPAATKLGVSDVGSTVFLDGDVAEFIFYNRVLSGAEPETVKAYLENKYALTLA